MIFNFNYAEISSLSGMSFPKIVVNNMDELYANLEDLRTDGKLCAANHAVMLTCCILYKQGSVKKSVTYELAYIEGGWMLRFKKPMPSM